MPELTRSSAALITENDSSASGHMTRMSPCAGYLTAQSGQRLILDVTGAMLGGSPRKDGAMIHA